MFTPLTLTMYTIILLFGVFVSAAFLGISLKEKNFWILLTFSILCLLSQGACSYLFNISKVQYLYPLITHIPLILLYVLFFHKNIVASILSVSSAYLCCHIAKWCSLLFFFITNNHTVENFTRILVLLLTLIVLLYFVVPSMQSIFQKDTKSLLILSILPLTYYFYDYIATVYTNLLYSGNQLTYEFLPFIYCFAYLFFCFIYFKEYEDKKSSEQNRKLIELQNVYLQKEIEATARTEYKISLIRHDMRHHLGIISTCIENKQLDQADHYIKELLENINQTSLKKYCANQSINMILSSYEEDFALHHIDFCYDLKLPARLPISDVDMTSILSNGIENAIHAVCKLDREKRYIKLNIEIKNAKLLISMENPCSDEESLEKEPSKNLEQIHGFGLQSISFVVKKQGGNHQFFIRNHVFHMRIILNCK